MIDSISFHIQLFLQKVVKRNDLVLATLIVCIIFMMILPLPTWLIDALIATNMCLSAILLMVAMYLPTPLAFSSFPSVLLITTLFRLAIGIATTRLILLNGDAGHIIYTFGNFVVGGNLVVGLVVFLILTIVQFVVITKGSERVAEVAARFSLDAMPGKQMSIDGDLRAGTIDMNEARRRRDIVSKESQLYGAMDGAMKFVKGDAIAGLIIVAVNLLGGVLIGVFMKGLTAADSVRIYSVLTIGDGLIAQIPALFVSICAGMIVTRVTGTDGGPSNVGSDIGAQLLAQPKAFLIGSVVMLGFAAIPGMPTLTFLILSVVVGVVGYVFFKGERKVVDPKTGKISSIPAIAAGDTEETQKAAETETFSPTIPLLVDLHPGLEKAFSTEFLSEELAKVRRALFEDLGLVFPGITLRFNQSVAEETYVIMVSEIPVSQGRLRPRYLFVKEAPENLKALAIPFEAGESFLPGMQTLWCGVELRQPLTNAGIPFLEPNSLLSYHIALVLKKHAAEFIGIQETRTILTDMEARLPELAKEVQRVMPIHKIAEILQRLVGEGVSVRNLRAVMEALIEWGQKEKDSVMLTEYVRVALKRHISFRHSGGNNLLPAYLLAPAAEDTVRAAIRQTSGGSYLALDPGTSRQLLENIKSTVGDLSRSMQKPVLLTSMDIRRYLRKMIEQDLYDLPVLSYQELTPEVNIQPLARVEL
jgi:type III secretion protein V